MTEIDDSLRELYQSLIVDHGRNPRHCEVMDDPTHTQCGKNPLCGDEITLQLKVVNGVIEKASFQGQGCAISMASTSLMLERLQGLSVAKANDLFKLCHSMLTDSISEEEMESLGKLSVLSGVSEYPVRVKCATLCWQSLHALLVGESEDITTE
jgi:nitrogen fixation protein NifU and related proteins